MSIPIKRIIPRILCVIIFLVFTLLVTTQNFRVTFFEKYAYAFQEPTNVDPGPSTYITIKSKSPKEYLEEAKALIAREQYEKALPICNYIVDITKDNSIKRDAFKQKRIIKKSIIKKEQNLRVQNSAKIKELREDGISAYQKGDLSTAEKKFNELLQINPDNSTASKYLQAYIPRKREELIQAQQKTAQRASREEQQAAGRAKQQKISSLYSQGKSYYGKGDLDNAANSFKEVLSLDPDHKASSKYLQAYIPRKREKLNKEKYIK